MTRPARYVMLLAAVACYPTTTRPALVPQPGAAVEDLELFVPEATREVALALDGDAIPVRRTEPRDGWLESEWFDARTMQVTGARPVGLDVVKVRAFIDPGQDNHSIVTIETVYRPLADPSRDGRELERQVPPDHRIAVKVTGIMRRLRERHGQPPADADSAAVQAPTPTPVPRDSTKP